MTEDARLMRTAMDEAMAQLNATGLSPLCFLMSPLALQVLAEGSARSALVGYRGVPIHEHDEWSWGWMLKAKNGQFFPPAE